jgi:hypothetical protein
MKIMKHHNGTFNNKINTPKMSILSALAEVVAQGFPPMLDDAQNVFARRSGHQEQLRQSHTARAHQT